MGGRESRESGSASESERRGASALTRSAGRAPPIAAGGRAPRGVREPGGAKGPVGSWIADRGQPFRNSITTGIRAL